tara:strand:+ start:658 stop:969 length:312 start_codon:yes stop_codon:yes gene_type:complete
MKKVLIFTLTFGLFSNSCQNDSESSPKISSVILEPCEYVEVLIQIMEEIDSEAKGNNVKKKLRLLEDKGEYIAGLAVEIYGKKRLKNCTRFSKFQKLEEKYPL